MRPLPSLVLLASLSVLVSVSEPAHAQTKEEMAQAKALGTDGLALYDKGDWAGALAKLDAADRLAKAPPLGLYAARCLDRLGRLVEAKQRYEDVTAIVLPPGAPPVWGEAKDQAAKELAALSPRVPHLEVVIDGLGSRQATVVVDGAPLPPGAAGVDVDPGDHEVWTIVEGRKRLERVSVKEGDRQTVRFRISQPLEPTPVAPSPEPSSGPSALGVVGWVTTGLGVAGLATWGATGGAALAIAGDRGCEGAACPAGEVDDLQALRTTSTVAFWVGAPLTLVGATLLVVDVATGDDGSETSAVSLAPVVAPGFVGLAGRF